MTPVLLSVQQKYIMETLRKLGYIDRRQLQSLVQGRFPEIDVSDRRMEAMLRQLFVPFFSHCNLTNKRF